MNHNTSTIRRPMIALLAVGTLALASLASASPFELRAGMPSVPGTAEFEAGNVDQAIEKLEAVVGKAQGQRKGSMLSTLCAAYIVKGDLGTATSYCDESVRFGQRIAHNNRGVLRALQGDFKGADSDFSIAAKKTYAYYDAKVTTARREVAERNAKRTQERWAAVRQQGDDLVAEGKSK